MPHTPVDAPDADITIQSSDGVKFHLHRKNLESHTGSFPGADVPTHGETTHLPERAKVLEVLFQFVYPRRHPISLRELEFATLMEVAEAAEKYEVWYAVKPYEDCLISHLPERAPDIMAHAIKHDIPDLIGKASQYIALQPSAELLKKLPTHLAVPMVEYQTTLRDSIFGAATRYIEALPYEGFYGSYCNKLTKGTCSADICGSCRVTLLAWIARLEKSGSIVVLRAALKTPVFDEKHQQGRELCSNCRENNCQNLPAIVKIVEDAIEGARPLSDFLQTK
ncbi:hypothetical protein CVT26_002270 [Gymnopilus dilepis]|uniref:BTB domain-containing protein n=1 Tax=Gymnopilus dilepis TaxID=231916 RepID=A0A409YMZ3_9AGAR|nr:hypothetical protein CVT26_002270 [Gymnopilus dilepis]